MKEITSLTNESVKFYVSLNHKKDRDAAKLFLIDGDHLVLEAAKYGLLQTVLFVDELPASLRSFPDLVKVTTKIAQKISNVEDPKNIIGICRYKNDEIKAEYQKFIALDGVQDPGNGGTILRSALAFNYDCMLLSEDSFDIYNSKFIRATMGAFFALALIRGDLLNNIAKLQAQDYQVIIADLADSALPLQAFKPKQKHIIVVGNEGNGLSNKVKSLANSIVKIEINPRLDSLNVGVAASILMYHFSINK